MVFSGRFQINKKGSFMSAKKILVVEDEEHISKLVSYNLENAGFKPTVASTGEDALDKLSKVKFDLILLDIMLPGIDGTEICKELKSDDRFAKIPIIMLTAKGEEIDRILGFEFGADDYVVKPFSPRELILRVKAILKRSSSRTSSDDVSTYLESGKIVVDIMKHTVTVSKKKVELTPIEFDLLVLFLRRKERVQSREVLLMDVWGIESEIETRTVDTHVKCLRQKLGKAGKAIVTVRGIGYKYTEET